MKINENMRQIMSHRFENIDSGGLDPFDKIICSEILGNNSFGISQVKSLGHILTTTFTQEWQKNLEDQILSGVRKDFWFKLPNSDAEEFLELWSFFDQVERKYFAMIYDSIQLQQNPKVLRIFSIDKDLGYSSI
jgi:hypothetical protein